MVGERRAAEGIRLHQLIWALLLSREHLWRFLRHQAFADNIVALYGEMELQRVLTRFFDQAIYYAVLGYQEAANCNPKGHLARVRDLAVAIGLMGSQDTRNASVEE
jgi:hypothetical protein